MSDQPTAVLSYARIDVRAPADKEAVLAVIEGIEHQVHAELGHDRFELWRDIDGIKTGEKWREALYEAIGQARVLIVLLSRGWLNSDECWREFEAFCARPELAHKRITVYPAQLRDIRTDRLTGASRDRYEALRAYQIADWRDLIQAELDGRQGAVRAILQNTAKDIADVLEHEINGHFLPSGDPPEWASGWGHDEYGVFVEFAVADVTQRMRWCPPGQFLMGSSENEMDRFENEGPQVKVTFAEGFWLFDTPVTNALYDLVMDRTTDETHNQEDPVTQVSWNDAQEFLQRLNALSAGLDLRLPSEAEWEYACRAGSNTPFEPNVARRFSGESITPEEVNYDGNYPYGDTAKGLYREKAISVRNFGFRPNKWGLWQMHGNVWEWCTDVWNESHEGANSDGSPRQASHQDGESNRVLRGGSWSYYARFCRSAYRVTDEPDSCSDDIGFRPARGQ